MTRLGRVVHKRAFVTLGHNSLPSACPEVGHKGVVQSAPVGGSAMPETYGYVCTSRPESPNCLSAPQLQEAPHTESIDRLLAVRPACGNRPTFLIVVDQRSEPGLAARHGEGPIFGLMAVKFYEPRSPTSFHASTFSSSIHPRWIMKLTWNVRFSSAAQSPTTKGITSFFESRRSTRIFAITYWRMS